MTGEAGCLDLVGQRGPLAAAGHQQPGDEVGITEVGITEVRITEVRITEVRITEVRITWAVKAWRAGLPGIRFAFRMRGGRRR
jgi:hypothetical protein